MPRACQWLAAHQKQFLCWSGQQFVSSRGLATTDLTEVDSRDKQAADKAVNVTEITLFGVGACRKCLIQNRGFGMRTQYRQGPVHRICKEDMLWLLLSGFIACCLQADPWSPYRIVVNSV